MTIADENRLNRLSPAASRLGRALAHPRAVAVVCILMLAGLGWIYLGVVVASAIGARGDIWGFLQILCSPTAAAAFGMPAAGPWGLGDIALVLLMWIAMVLAMMLPTASPMILTYAEIADTAVGKGERVVSPFVLAGGYGAVWIGFAFAAALLQALLVRATLLDPAMAPAGLLLSGEIFVGAGLYQFSALKSACLTRCQSPFPFFFANWATTPQGVFALGARQGLHCLGCCWALMLVMLAVGTMNVVWMIALGVIMAAEKLTTTPRFSHVVGAVFIVIGLGFLFTYVEFNWPAWSRIESV
ncbi:MAG: DUF2182 domain-containing protein [Rhizobiales bacterium]|nr:DUF2182 domain-containing protein [Hyphomicrobiales bacterium]